jgi:ATP-dependent RNA helicase DeaD
VTAAIKKIIPENSISIRLKNKLLTLKGVKQMYFYSKRTSKFEIIEDLFNELGNTQIIVFINTKNIAEMAHRNLTMKGYKAEIINGNVEPVDRDRIMKKFREKELQFLLATNSILKGIHTSDSIKLVIDLDIPTFTVTDGFVNVAEDHYFDIFGNISRVLTVTDDKEESMSYGSAKRNSG